MTKNKIIKSTLTILVVGVLIVSGIAYYMFNMPHRNVQNTSTDYQLTATSIVDEYLKDPNLANDKYLDDEGESKIIEITGEIANISTDFNNQKVILFKDENAKAGVTCTFTQKTNESISSLKEGQSVTVKGVIRAGANYDEDLEMYENVILEKCSLIN
ncbi:MAG: OB-fold putative lipoprotein [Flavobacteriaceae bacterium]|nr:OB-fold putative lipoprotein [Flavobacteriaceae bacterium]